MFLQCFNRGQTLITFIVNEFPEVSAGRDPTDDLLLEMFDDGNGVLDMGRVGVVDQADQVVVQHSISRGQEINQNESFVNISACGQ